MLNLEHILRFAIVAQELSFTRAAKRLNVDQPWLSRQIMHLEGQLGTELFHRKARKIELTETGLEFLECAEKLHEVSQILLEKSDEIRRRRRIYIKVGVAYSAYWFDSRGVLIDEFEAEHPNLNLETSVSELSELVLDQIRSGAVDVGIITEFGSVDDPSIECVPIEHVVPTLSIPKEDPLAYAEHVALSDLHDRNVAVSSSARQTWDQHPAVTGWISDVGAHPAVIPEGRRFMFEAARRHRLVVLNLSAYEFPPTDDFVRRAVDGPCPTGDICLVRLRTGSSPAAERFWRHGMAYASQK